MAKLNAKPTAETPRRRVASSDSSLRASASPRLKSSSLLDTRVVYCGDNLEQLAKLPDACVDLIYIDPPFNSNRNYEVFWGETKEKRAFEDRHESTRAYIDYMRPRCVQLARVLKQTGSFYYHCDWHTAHYVKVMLGQGARLKGAVSVIMNCFIKSGLRVLVGGAACLLVTGFAAESAPPSFSEVQNLLRLNLPGVTASDLDHAALQGLLNQFPGRVAFVTNATPDSAASLVAGTNLFDDAFAYVRVARIAPGAAKQVDDALEKFSAGRRLKGLVLDLRSASGDDYAAATGLANLFVSGEKRQLSAAGLELSTAAKTDAYRLPLAVLVNRQTAGAAEAVAAVLRQNHVGLLLGGGTAGQAYVFKEFPLSTGQRLKIANGSVLLADGQPIPAQGMKPDITLEVNPADEAAYLKNPFGEIGKAAPVTPASLTTTNAPRQRINEAELVRRQRDGQNVDEESGPALARPAESAKPLVRDPVLARALDLLKGLAVVNKTRAL